jgi:RimJ/RimL family protein N-acetyltransferase
MITNAPILTGKKIKLRPKSIQDAATDYKWRTDPELCHLDAASTIDNSFQEFLEHYREQFRFHVPGLRFAIETTDGKHIGNCSLFNIDDNKKATELGIMIGEKTFWGQGYGTDAILTLLNYVFTQTELQKVFLKTLYWNVRAQKCFKKCGFTSNGSVSYNGLNFILMEISQPKQQGFSKAER